MVHVWLKIKCCNSFLISEKQPLENHDRREAFKHAGRDYIRTVCSRVGSENNTRKLWIERNSTT